MGVLFDGALLDTVFPIPASNILPQRQISLAEGTNMQLLSWSGFDKVS